MGISYLNFQRSGTYPLDFREWEMCDPTTKLFANLQTAFIVSERRLQTQRGQGVPQGITNNLEDLQRALEGVTMATAQEQEDAAAAIVQNKNIQKAVNALQIQMAGVIPSNDTTVNVVNRQQLPMQNAGQQQAPPQYGNYNGSGNVATCQAPQTQPKYCQQQQQQQQNFQPTGGRRQRDRSRRGYGHGNGFGGIPAQGGGKKPQQI